MQNIDDDILKECCKQENLAHTYFGADARVNALVQIEFWCTLKVACLKI
jgi:hypothetical protein